MAFSSSLRLRLIHAKGIVGSSSNHCILGKWSARSCASSFNRRGLSTATTASETAGNQDSSPWLMLSPELEGGATSYKFYSLADNKVKNPCLSDKIRNVRLTCRGSSHGWLALLSPCNDDFFLYNPISRRHIKLPSVTNIPDASVRTVDKVILSCSPDDEENCRVLIIIRGPGNVLAFCCPGRSKEWTLLLDEQVVGRGFCTDCVYSTRLKLFFALDSSNSGLETWDLGDPSSPKLIKVDEMNLENCYSMLDTFLWYTYGTMEHLVVAKEDLLLIIQYIGDHVGPDGSCFKRLDDSCPDNSLHMTIGFDIFKYDSEKGKFKYLDRSSLGDLAIFVGSHSHSVAIQATQFPGVKPNSVYFTDAYGTGHLEGDESYRDNQICGHDIGIYNYQDKTVSPCYYPCDVPSVKTILPAPIWFFPN